MSQSESGNGNLYYAHYLKWDAEIEEYEGDGPVLFDGDELEFATYADFLKFMENLSDQEKHDLGLWEICHEYSDETLMISDGIFDDVSFLSLAADRNEK